MPITYSETPTITSFFGSFVLCHVGLSAHAREIPSRLAVSNPPSKVPDLLHIVLPVVLIDVTCSHLHTIQTKTMEVGTNLLVSVLHACRAQLRCALPSSALGDLGTPFREAVAVKNLLNRLLVVFVERPDARLAQGEVVCKMGFFLAVALLFQKAADWFKEAPQQLASQTASRTIQ